MYKVWLLLIQWRLANEVYAHLVATEYIGDIAAKLIVHVSRLNVLKCVAAVCYVLKAILVNVGDIILGVS
jgi:hypothetical protein